MNKRYYELIDETIYSFICDNGLKVFLLKKEDYHKTYGILATKFGSLNDEFVINKKIHKVIDGAAHFLEHKMFEKANYDVMDIFNKQHASCNAFTSFDKTAYLFSCSDMVEENVITLLDFVQSIELTDESIEKEKPIIEAEINMYKDNVDWQCFFNSLNALYHNHPIKKDIAGSVESIYQITKNDLELYYNTFYHPKNMILFICGNININSLKNVIRDNQDKKVFDDISFSLHKTKEMASIKYKYFEAKMDINNTKISYNIKINDFVIDYLKQDFAMTLLLDMIFSTSNSFYLELIEKHIITSDYQYSYQQDFENNYAFFQLQFTSLDNDYLIGYLKDFFNNDLSLLLNNEDFNILKAKYTGDFIRLFDNPDNIANSFISFYFSGGDLFSVLNTLNDLELDDLKKLCPLLNNKHSSISVIKPN